MRAYVTMVKVGNLEIEGMMDEEGKYYVAVPQLTALNLTNPNHATRDLKRLLGKDSRLSKLKTKFTNNPVSSVPLDQFHHVLFELSLKGNKSAQGLMRSLVGLSLHQLFSDAFGAKFEAEDRQAWLIDRVEGKGVRRTLTDAIHDHLASQGKGNAFGYYAQITNKIYQGIFGMDANEIRRELGVTGYDLTRDYLNAQEIRTVASVEELVMDLIDHGANPFEAVGLALSIKRKSRLILRGR